MNQADINVHDRAVVDAAIKEARKTEGPAAALELHDGTIVTGKTSNLLGASAALLQTQYLGSKNPRLHTDEVLIALSVSAATDTTAQLALDQLPKLKGCQAHTSVMVSTVDIKQFKKLSIQATFEAMYEKNTIFFMGKGV